MSGLQSDALTDWWDGGEPRVVAGHRLQVRVRGTGPVIVLLHGFPASSFEWAAIEPLLAAQHAVVTFDFLGYGASDKPPGHRYSVFEQADLTQQLLADLDIDACTVVAYDYGAIVAAELLARSEPRITRCILLNAGIFAEQYRPRLAQRLAITPVAGALVARLFNERIFTRTWGEVFSSQHPLDREYARLNFRALRQGDPSRDVQRRLLQYIPERAANDARLHGAILNAAVPVHFLWGMADPVSGRLIADELTARLPNADLVELDAGHCPHVEIPDVVAAEILSRTHR